MSWRAPTDPQKFEEAAAWFLRRLPLTADDFLRLCTHWRREAFTITGVAQVRVLEEVMTLIDRSLSDGLGYNAFRDAALPKLEAAWAGTVRDPGFRTETIYRNAVQTAYNDGRRELMLDPDVARARPFMMFDAVMDEATSDICTSLNGTVLPNDDPFWGTHWPPLHHRCRSAVRTLSRSEAERRGVAPIPPDVPAQEGFGVPRRALADDGVDLSGAPSPVRAAYERRQARAPTEPSPAARRIATQPGLFGTTTTRAV